MNDYLRIAADMLCLSELDLIPQDLRSLLDEANRMAAEQGGGLYSRQVIATLITTWRFYKTAHGKGDGG